MDISAYSVRKITATAHHRNKAHWIEMSIQEDARDFNPKIILFMDGNDAAALTDAYAAAINSVNEPVSMAEAT